MARIVKEEEYAARRNEILDAAYKLIFTKGYEQMTIQDILDDLRMSKGAFYHYFDSKPALLEALIDRLVEETEVIYAPIIQDVSLSALEKLERFFLTVGQWKSDNKSLILALTRVWYADNNAIVRQKQTMALVDKFAPLITGIVNEGIREGTFETSYPEYAGEIILSLILGMGESLARLILASEPEENRLERLTGTVAAFEAGLERLLGAAPGTLHLVDYDLLKVWVEPEVETAKTGLS
jgi:AcrR family transcriptional regulator